MVQDSDLLRDFAQTRSEAAFAELVRRHVNLVYSIATRQVGGDQNLAQDVTQQVFAALATKAARLHDRPTLGGWLIKTTLYEATDMVRSERRRRAREQEAIAMNVDPSADEHIDWDRARPLLDEAVAELNDPDRDGVYLRFFEGRSFAEIGGRLGLNENAARMRVERALEKLQRGMERRGITSTSAAVAVALAGQIGAAPAALITSVSSAALLTTSTSIAGTFLGFMSATKLGIGVTGVAVIVGITTAVLEFNHTKTPEKTTQATAKEVNRIVQTEQDSTELPNVREAPSELNNPVSNSRESIGAEGDEVRRFKEELAARIAEAQRLGDQNARLLEGFNTLNPATKLLQLIAESERRIAIFDFQGAQWWLNHAKREKPDDQAVIDHISELSRQIQEEANPVNVLWLSDGKTYLGVFFSGTGMIYHSPSARTMIPLASGDYTVIGRRRGFQDVTTKLRVRYGEPPPVLNIACTVPANQ